MANNIVEYSSLIEKLNKILDANERQLILNAEATKKYNKALKVPSSYIQGQKTQEQNAKLLTKAEKETESAIRKAGVERRKRESQVKKESDFRERLLKQRLKEEAQSRKETALNAKLAMSWNQLNSKLAKAELNYRNLSASQGLSNKRTKQAQREVLKLRHQIDKINQPIKRWNGNVGNYASGLKNLAGALGWAGLAFAMINGVKAAYETIKSYEVLNKSIEKVTVSQSQARAEFAFSVDLSGRLGLSIEKTTQDYVAFLASIKGTNLEGAKGRKIFESISKAASSMGLSAEDTSGTLKALNQIISKGKVQAEELRGQLGDRIPGAFQIMARSMKVTTSELDKLLKDGKLLSDEVLPAFAVEMERSFGVENTDRIDNLSAAQNRFTNSWDKLILAIESGDGIISRFLKNLYADWTSTFGVITKMIRGYQGELDDISLDAYQKQADIIQLSNKKTEASLKSSLTAVQYLLKERIKALELEKKFVPANKKQREEKEASIKVLEKEISVSKGRQDAINDALKTLKLEKNSLIDKIILKDQSLKQSDLEIKSLKYLRELYDKLNVSEKEHGEIKRKNVEAITLEVEAEKGLIDIINEHIKALEMSRDMVMKNTKEYADYTKQIDALKSGLEAQIEVDEQAVESMGERADAAKQAMIDQRKLEIATEDYLKTVSTGALGDLGMGSLETFFDGTFEKLMEGADGLGEKFAVTFNAISEVAKEAFAIINQVSAENFNAQYTRLETQKDFQLRFAGESATAKEEIEKQYEIKRAAIQKRQAESQKKMAIFNIITSTAQGVVAALATGNIPLSIAVGLIGAANLAVVQSQQIPEFKDGVENFKGGQAIVGDGGKHEYITTRGGGVFKTPKTDTLVNLPANSNVYKDEDAFMNSGFINSLYNELALNDIMPFSSNIGKNIMPAITQKGITKEEISQVFSREISKLSNTIKNKKESTINMDENGFNLYVSQGHTKKQILNARVNGRGNKV